MGKPITVKLQDEVLKEAEEFIPKSKLGSRNAYINEAVRRMNKVQARRQLALEYQQQSCLVRDESRAVLAEFESLPEELFE